MYHLCSMRERCEGFVNALKDACNDAGNEPFISGYGKCDLCGLRIVVENDASGLHMYGRVIDQGLGCKLENNPNNELSVSDNI